jgi:tetratricopeptide (TPR) repeat protein
LYNSFDESYRRAVEDNSAPAVISLYEENRGWLEVFPNQNYENRVKIRTVQALNELGITDSARSVFDTVTPMVTPEYAKLNYALCRPPTVYNINKLPSEELKNLAAEVERNCSTDYTLSFLARYTQDPAAALSARYNLLSRVSAERERTDILTDIYNELERNPASRFPGYEKAYLDMGLDAYKKNNYQGAINALRQYVDVPIAADDKKSEALYYLGKSLTMINEKELALQYYNRLVNDMPDSVFKSMARSELEDDAWRKGLNR